MNVFFEPIIVSNRGLISHRVCGAETARAAKGYGLELQLKSPGSLDRDDVRSAYCCRIAVGLMMLLFAILR